VDIQIDFFEIVATLLTFITVYLLAIPKRIGYHVATISQIFWIIFSVKQHHYILAVQAIVLICVNFYGNYMWKKKGIGD
jgi:nicotinamide riboside transporter PnuC